MKYLQKTFTVGGHTDAYSDGWERVFGKKGENVSETKRSPEPWTVFDAVRPGIDAGNGEGVVMHTNHPDDEPHAGVMGGWDGITDPSANARRIVACVNALAGIPTEALEKGWLNALLRHAGDVLCHLDSECEESDCDTRLGLMAALRALGRLP